MIGLIFGETDFPKYIYKKIRNKKKYTIRNKFIRKVVDTSGAGDGFNAAYVSNFIIHNDPALALKEASLLGSKIIMQKGAIVDVK